MRRWMWLTFPMAGSTWIHLPRYGPTVARLLDEYTSIFTIHWYTRIWWISIFKTVESVFFISFDIVMVRQLASSLKTNNPRVDLSLHLDTLSWFEPTSIRSYSLVLHIQRRSKMSNIIYHGLFVRSDEMSWEVIYSVYIGGIDQKSLKIQNGVIRIRIWRKDNTMAKRKNQRRSKTSIL
jgi:hypothetical protein